uniref:Uncharacterized protein n=1 Tax=Ditylenchus dipsaci TaxID=166011 RepID=A0A915DAU4_9BILA
MVVFCAKSINLCRLSALRFVAMRAKSDAPKVDTAVSKLALCDIVGTPGEAADLSHVNTLAQVRDMNEYYSQYVEEYYEETISKKMSKKKLRRESHRRKQNRKCVLLLKRISAQSKMQLLNLW